MRLRGLKAGQEPSKKSLELLEEEFTEQIWPLKEPTQTSAPTEPECSEPADRHQSGTASPVSANGSPSPELVQGLVGSCRLLLGLLRLNRPDQLSEVARLLDLLEHHAKTPDPSVGESSPPPDQLKTETEPLPLAKEDEIQEELSRIFWEGVGTHPNGLDVTIVQKYLAQKGIHV